MIIRRPLTEALVNAIRGQGILCDIGAVPEGAGWNGQPNTNGSNFIPYTTILPQSSSNFEGPMAKPQSEWRFVYACNSYGVTAEQTEWMADKVRTEALLLLKGQSLALNPQYFVVWIGIDSIGGLVRNDGTDPPYWGQQDALTFWLSEEAT